MSLVNLRAHRAQLKMSGWHTRKKVTPPEGQPGKPVTGEIPAGLPALQAPALQLRDVEGIVAVVR